MYCLLRPHKKFLFFPPKTNMYSNVFIKFSSHLILATRCIWVWRSTKWNLDEFVNRADLICPLLLFWASFQRTCDSAASLLCLSVSAVSSSAFRRSKPRQVLPRRHPLRARWIFRCKQLFFRRAPRSITLDQRERTRLTREQLRRLAASSSRVTCLG